MTTSTRLSIGCAAATLAVMVQARAARAADYYVAPPPPTSSGSDTTGDGSQGKPWATIGHAASHAAAGDTVHVAPGTYAETLNTKAVGTATKRITYVSDVTWGAKLDATGNYTAWQNTGDYVDIVGFDITGSDYLGILNLASNVRVIGNHVHDLATPTCNGGSGGAGIDQGEYTKQDNDTIGNVVDHIADKLTNCNTIQGIYHSNLRGHIWNNIVYKIGAYCLHNWHASTDVVIANNLAFSCGKGGLIVGDGDAPGNVTANNFVVSNNIILDSPIGIYEYGAVGTNNKYEDNLVFNCTTPLILKNTDQGTLRVNPMFVNYQADGTGDYHLRLGSPCVDTGTATGAPSTDFDGLARPQGKGFDIGPYELCQGGNCMDAGALDAAAPPPDGGSRSDGGGSGSGGGNGSGSGGSSGSGGGSGSVGPDGGGSGSDLDAAPAADGGDTTNGAAPSGANSGCACALAGPRGSASGAIAGVVGALLLLLRRRRNYLRCLARRSWK